MVTRRRPAESCAGHSDVLRTVAAHGLVGSMLTMPSEPLTPAQWSSLRGGAVRQRITGLMWDAIATGALPVTDAQLVQAEETYVSALSGCLVLEQLMLRTVTALERADISTRVLKGTASAWLDYPQPGLRSFGDVDLLVPGADFDRAVAVLVSSGHRRIYQEPRRGFDQRFGKGASFHTPERLEIDLHRTFTMGPFGLRLDLAAIWERSEDFVVSGKRLRALGPEERLLHACYHAALGEIRTRLVPLRDVAQLSLTRALDMERLHLLIRNSGAEAVVARAVRLAWAEFDIADITALSAWAQAVQVDPRAAADLAVYGENSSYTTKAIAAIRALPRTRDKVSYLVAMVVPQRTYLADRHTSRAGRLRHGLRERTNLRRVGGS